MNGDINCKHKQWVISSDILIKGGSIIIINNDNIVFTMLLLMVAFLWRYSLWPVGRLKLQKNQNFGRKSCRSMSFLRILSCSRNRRILLFKFHITYLPFFVNIYIPNSALFCILRSTRTHPFHLDLIQQVYQLQCHILVTGHVACSELHSVQLWTVRFNLVVAWQQLLICCPIEFTCWLIPRVSRGHIVVTARAAHVLYMPHSTITRAVS